MKRFTQILPVVLAAALQIMPLVRNFFINPATGSTIAFILRWGIGTGTALGAVDAVSGATTMFTSPGTFTGEAGAYMSNNVVVAIGGGHKSTSKDYIVLQAGTTTSPLLLNGQSTTVALPGGLSFTASWVTEGTTLGGYVRGTPATAGTNVVKVTVVSPGNASLFQNLTLAIGAPLVPTPPFFVTPPADTNVPAGRTAVFRVTASGSAPLAYRWAKDNVPLANGGNISGVTSNVLTIAAMTTNDIGSYSVTVTNSLGTTNASAVLGIVIPPLITSHPAGQTGIGGSNVSFAVTATGTAPVVYRWLKNGAGLTNGTKFSGVSSSLLNIATLTTNDAGNYSVVITNAAGSVTSSVAALTVLLPPTFTLQASNRAARLGTNTVFRAAATGTAPLAFQWFKDGSPLADGGNVSGANSNVLALTLLTTNDAGAYSLVVSNRAALIASSNALLTLLLPPVITLQPTNQDIVISNGVSFSVAAEGTAPFKYQWKKAITNAKTGKVSIKPIKGATNAVYSISAVTVKDAAGYFAVVANAASSATSSVANLKVLLPAAFASQAGSRAVKLGTNTVFSATLKGTGPFACQWFRDGQPLADAGNVTGANSNVLALTALTTNDNGAYSLVASNAVNTIVSSNALLTVLVPPTIIAAPTNQAAALSNSVSFSVAVDGTAPFKYQWKKGKLLIKGATNATLAIPSIKLTDAATNYLVTIANAAGSVTSAPVALTIVPAVVTVNAVAARSAVIAPQPPGEIGLVANPDGSMTVYFTGVPNASYTLESTDSLNAPDWQSVGSGPAQPDGSWQMTDPAAAARTQRFYRVSSP
jgi:hypothetical protein